MKDHDVREREKDIERCWAIGKPFENQYYTVVLSNFLVVGMPIYFITVVQAPDSNSWCVWQWLWVGEWYYELSFCSTATLLLTACLYPREKRCRRARHDYMACVAKYDAGELHANAVPTRCKSRVTRTDALQLVQSDSNDDDHVDDTQKPSMSAPQQDTADTWRWG